MKIYKISLVAFLFLQFICHASTLTGEGAFSTPDSHSVSTSRVAWFPAEEGDRMPIIPRRSRNQNICGSFISWIRSFCGGSETQEDDTDSDDKEHFFRRILNVHVGDDKLTVRKSAQKTVSHALGLAGSLVLGWQAYRFVGNFTDDPVLYNALGVPLGIISAIPPFMGFSTLIDNKLRGFFFPERTFNSYTNALDYSDVLLATLRSIPSIIATVPISWVAYETMHPVIGDLSHFFETCVFLGLYSYYNKTIKEFTGRLFEKIDPSFFCRKCERKRDSFSNKAPHLISAIGGIPDVELDALCDLMHTNPEAALREIYRRVDLPRENDMSINRRCPTYKSICIGAGSVVAAAGAAFFYNIAYGATERLLADSDLSEGQITSFATAAAVISASLRGVFNVVAASHAASYLWDESLKCLRGRQKCDRLSPVKIFLAAVGAIPSTEISVEHLGFGTTGILLSAATFEAIFLDSIWGMDLLLKKYVKSKEQSKRDFLSSVIYEINSVYPRLKPRYRRYVDSLSIDSEVATRGFELPEYRALISAGQGQG